MKRRNFLKGLLASTASAPVAASIQVPEAPEPEPKIQYPLPPDPEPEIESVTIDEAIGRIGKNLIVTHRAGDLSMIDYIGADHIELRGLYGALKNLWRYSDHHLRYDFPLVMYTDVQAELAEKYTISERLFSKLVRAGLYTHHQGNFITLRLIGQGTQTKVFVDGTRILKNEIMINIDSEIEISRLTLDHEKLAYYWDTKKNQEAINFDYKSDYEPVLIAPV
jgi:hypothetical protein